MLTRAIANSLMGIIPEKVAATVVLAPDTTPVQVPILSAWFKPISSRLTTYGGLHLQGDETLIKIPDRELNPAGNGHEIRPQDCVTVSGVKYVVIYSTLKSVRTVWECLVRKEMI